MALDRPSTRPGTPSRRRSARTGSAIALVGLLVLVGCGSDGDGDGGSSDTTPPVRDASTTTVAASADAFEPVTIEHRWGSTEITEAPERIVTIDTQWTDVLLSLGTTPVGFVADPTIEGTYPWQEDRLDDATQIPYSGEIPYEQIKELQPDLIVATWAVQDQNAYDQLVGIAPTIGSLSDVEIDTWQEITGVAGRVLGKQVTAQGVVDDVDAQARALADDLPGLEGRTIAFANYVPGDAIYVLSNPKDGANVLFDQLGLSIAPGIADEGGDAAGRVKVSLENVGILDGDALLILTNDADVDDIVGWDNLPAVRNDAVLVMDYTQATALNTPSPLSLPWALDDIRPTLEAVAG